MLCLVHLGSILLLTSLSLTLTDGVHASSPIEAPLSWGRHALKGWWNPHSAGRRPAITLDDYDYIVIGSGPGGAPLAARLGLAGNKVRVIEAGQDAAATNDNATVPILNAKASEDEQLSWDFYVDHYPDYVRNALDPKFTYQLRNGSTYHGLSPPDDATPRGFFYPRTAALGGCANHNAMIMALPRDDDWTELEMLTGDSSWSATSMRTYFERLEHCQYVARGSPGHGYEGWLSTNRADPNIFLSDSKVFWMMKAAASIAGATLHSAGDLLAILSRDLNARSVERGTERGLHNAPLSMDEYKRSSPRDFLLAAQQRVAAEHGAGKIDIRLDCLATRIIFAPGTAKAVGVEFLDGQSLYKADPRYRGASGIPGVAFARREVILAGGAYNTPQLLMLSGVGAPGALRRRGIPQVLALPGVGRNLQDRIENSVIAETTTPWTVFANCTFGATDADPCLSEWRDARSNSTRYATNGRPAHIPFRSKVAPSRFNDLVVTGRPGYFEGYVHGYATAGSHHPNAWTWPVLKAYTTNRAGLLSLRSDDPRETPYINFNFFDAGSGDWDTDLDATVEGMQFAREIFAEYASSTNTQVTELVPGERYRSAEELREWVRYNSWGHHACCTCPIGHESDPMAVLDGDFRVRGASGLRVVDASIFPRIPGYYIQSSIYAISEKAADVIIASKSG